MDVFQDSEAEADNDAEYEWGMVDRMRLWRHDALMQHLYETAAFWGDKILSWTNDPNDAFWLAQTYFMTHQYSRAERLLTRPFPIITSEASDKPINGYEHSIAGTSTMSGFTVDAKGKGKEVPFQLDQTPRLPMGPSGMIEIPEALQSSVSRLVDMSVACRYLAAQCQVRQGNWADATELLGEANPFRHSGRTGPAVPNTDGGIKVEASMCHLRGILMLKLNRGDQAKQCFMEALALDVKCYDAFDQLVTGEMMAPDEEWEFVQGLAYKEQTSEDADFVQLIYTSRLRKYKHAEEHALTRRRLVDEFGLSDNPDVLFSFADALYAQFRWADCYAITNRILSLVAVHTPTMPLHIACMYHLSHLQSKLFILAHELVDREPENPISWYAVGVWYLGSGKWSQARQYFSKTSLMDPRFGPAWIAFAHTFALEGEHDHAVTAYSTCARMFAGSHLPLLFVGMEQIMLSNHSLADEALRAAHASCDGDPLLVNELGVMAFTHGDLQRAADLFQRSLDLAQVTQSSESSWTTTYLNLGTCHRKLKNYHKAKENYQRVLEISPQHPQGLAYMGMIYHQLDEVDKAIEKYHEALSVDPINGHVIELLNLALESNIACGALDKIYPGGEEAFKRMMAKLKVKYHASGHFQKRAEETKKVSVPRDGTDEAMALG
ncbi:TPR-like protein [Leucogyrophana mollusca]|uniref:TPR-like protein n=1 Tax=Leucogyrophana mollusca TaxID=85980 RepID=A0ACB8B3Y4_9AGAM|nr:TPR-like protein [Leucogyrophana mollusca]